MNAHNEKDKDQGGVLCGGLLEVVRQMEDMTRALKKNSNGESLLNLPLPANLRFQTLKQEKEKGVLCGDVRDAVRQMDELTRQINKNSKK